MSWTHPDPRAEALERHYCQHTGLRISAFNIQIFGDTKYEKEGVTDVLVQILSQYDLIFIQEIRDKAKNLSLDLAPDSFKNLIKDLNNYEGTEGTYEYVISKRLGRGNSKEQYAYVYKSDKLGVTATHQSNDFTNYERPPFAARFSAPNCEVSDFSIIGIHVDPDEVPREMEALYDVYEEIANTWETPNIVLMGDFNAGGSYISIFELEQLRLRKNKNFDWLISDYVDTTVKGTCYAYDRFIAIGEGFKNSIVKNSAHPFLYDKALDLDQDMAEDVSDHYPIEFMVYGKVKDELHNAFITDLHLSTKINSSISASGDEVNLLAKDLRTLDSDDMIAGWNYEMSGTKIILYIQDIEDVVHKLESFDEKYPHILSKEMIAGCDSYMAAMKHFVIMPRIHSVTTPRTGHYDAIMTIDQTPPHMYDVCINISE